MSSNFFALLSRMKYINRWGLMRNTKSENIAEHSLDVAMIAHALAVLYNERFGGDVSADRAALIALYHDAPEILTGDLPTPVKYYNPDIKDAYKKVENIAALRLVAHLPEDIKKYYTPLFFKEQRDDKLWQLVKAADKISAYLKCIEEEKSGNSEFKKAALSLKAAIDDMNLPEVDCFIEEFADGYQLTLDELD